MFSPELLPSFYPPNIHFNKWMKRNGRKKIQDKEVEINRKKNNQSLSHLLAEHLANLSSISLIFGV